MNTTQKIILVLLVFLCIGVFGVLGELILQDNSHQSEQSVIQVVVTPTAEFDWQEVLRYCENNHLTESGAVSCYNATAVASGAVDPNNQ